MPGWHEATKELQESGGLQMLGIVQEQHPDRARLFQQWKELDWPILVDRYNLLEVPYVPITLAIDEYGIIRKVAVPMSNPGDVAGKFVAAFFEPPAGGVGAAEPASAETLRRRAEELGTPAALREHAGALARSDAPAGEVIDAYAKAADLDADHGYTQFRLGVAHRMRYDSPAAKAGDFAAAVDRWTQALEIDPNNYIWRRRIQQYGPRLDKPYPFYDWVPQARRAISERGDTPVPLVVEPGPAEYAGPRSSFPLNADPEAEEPDPEGKVTRDEAPLVRAHAVAVPPVVEPGQTARVHLVFEPNPDLRAHWNNEVDDLEVWVDPPGGWAADARRFTVSNPKEVLSRETRRVEFEVRCPEDAEPGPATVSAHALYYACEDTGGVCVYRRKDVSADLRVVEEGP